MPVVLMLILTKFVCHGSRTWCAHRMIDRFGGPPRLRLRVQCTRMRTRRLLFFWPGLGWAAMPIRPCKGPANHPFPFSSRILYFLSILLPSPVPHCALSSLSRLVATTARPPPPPPPPSSARCLGHHRVVFLGAAMSTQVRLPTLSPSCYAKPSSQTLSHLYSDPI